MTEFDLGSEHYARWTCHGPEGEDFITKVVDLDAWAAGDRSEANTRRVSIEHQPRLSNGERVSGLIIRHRSVGQNRHNAGHAAATGEWCESSLNFWEPESSGHPTWQLVSLEPLHIEPSVLCNCGDHGFIRDGKWVAA